MRSNDEMTFFEMTEIAEDIILRENTLDEDMTGSIQDFAENYRNMKEILNKLQDVLKEKAKSDRSSSHLMGDGSFIKAIGAARKIEAQLDKMNHDAKQFVLLMKQALS